MGRCLELAEKGLGNVAPNPMVGAVLVYNNRIIGEGWHQEFGKAHAEVNCLGSVPADQKSLIKDSVLYVSLEPCSHHGKTPPCTELIIKSNIKNVVIGCIDPFLEVSGKGIQQMKDAGITVKTGILEEECRWLNRRFFTFIENKRPYIILKWAQTANHFIGYSSCPGEINDRLMISGDASQRLVHKWRSEEPGIMAGTNTILQDDPMLNTRLWEGTSPVKVIIDKELKIPVDKKVFDGDSQTIIFNHIKDSEEGSLLFYRIKKEEQDIPQILTALYTLAIQSILVEGGAALLKSFIDAELWNEARVITNTTLEIDNGLPAPVLQGSEKMSSVLLGDDSITIYRRSSNG